jgi:hypothetical protein
MLLSKRETVTLAQVLAIYAEQCKGTSDFQRATEALRQRAEDSLAADPDAGCCADPACNPFIDEDAEDDAWPSVHVEEDDDEKADDDELTEEEAASEEDEEEREVSGEGEAAPPEAAGPAAEDCSGGSEEEGLRADKLVSVGQLLRLPFVKTNLGKARFNTDGDQINLTCTGVLVGNVEDVTHLKRFAKALHVCDGEGEWHVLNVAKWPKLWTARLPTKKLVEVVQ